MTASSAHRRRRAVALAGSQALVVRWCSHHPDPGRGAVRHDGPPVYRLLIACRVCGAPYVGERDNEVLQAWADHVRGVHPELLGQVPYAAGTG